MRLRETLRPDKIGIFCSVEVEERSNTTVLQVMRQVRTENYSSSGVIRLGLANFALVLALLLNTAPEKFIFWR